MKKRVLACTAVVLALAMPAGVFAAQMTPEELYQKTQEANASMTQLSCKAKGNADLTVSIGTGDAATQIPVKGTMDVSIQMQTDPYKAEITASMAGDAMGQSGDLDCRMYMITGDDSTGMIYMNMTGAGQDTGWVSVPMDAATVSEIQASMEATKSGNYDSLSKETGIDLKALQDKLLEDAQVSSETVEVSGKDCCELTETVKGETLADIFSQILQSDNFKAQMESQMKAQGTAEDAGESEIEMISQAAGIVLSGVKMDIREDYDAQSFKAVHSEMDLSGSDFSSIAQMIASYADASSSSLQTEGETEPAAAQISVDVSALNLAIDYDYDTPVSITVPEEALNARPAESMLSTEAEFATESQTEA